MVEGDPNGKAEGVVITIGANGEVVDPDSGAVVFANEVAALDGGLVLVRAITNEGDDERPIQVNPAPSPSSN